LLLYTRLLILNIFCDTLSNTSSIDKFGSCLFCQRNVSNKHNQKCNLIAFGSTINDYRNPKKTTHVTLVAFADFINHYLSSDCHDFHISDRFQCAESNGAKGGKRQIWAYVTFWATVCKTVRPMLSDRCLSVLSVTLVYCGRMVGRNKMKLGMQVGLGPGHIVLDGTRSPSPKGAQPPQFLAHICCVPMARRIKMPLGRKVGLNPSDTVLDGDPVPPPKKGAQPPIFGPCLLCPNGWMDQDATWHGGGPRPRPHCARWGPSSPSPERGTAPAPIFGPYVSCGQTDGWIKMSLGTIVGLGPGNVVLDK